MFLSKRKLKRYLEMSDTELYALILNAPNAYKKRKDRYALMYSLEAINQKKGHK